jgi:hypothetical protein
VAAASAPAAPVVATLALPRADRFDAIATVGGRVILSGGPQGSLAISASDALGAVDCDSAAVVAAATPALTDALTGHCDDPALYGRRTLVINSFINGNADGGNVRIARATPAGTALGPIVMTYTELSDTDAEWVYGDGSLWLYDCLTSDGSELLRISPATGAVLQTIPMPDIDRPLIAADADGFWLAPAGNSGGHGVYHVAPGMTRARLVGGTGHGALWLVAAGHSVWVDVNNHPRPATLLRFAGDRLVATAHSKPSLSIGEFGYGEPKFVAGAGAIWTVQGQEVLRIDPATGRVAPYARLPGAYGQPTPVALGGWMFVLESPTRLYRVRL